MNIIIERSTIDPLKMPPLRYHQAGSKAYVTCPKGHIMFLKHDIDDNGKVTPSIGCPKAYNNSGDCDWHVFAILKDWKPKNKAAIA